MPLRLPFSKAFRASGASRPDVVDPNASGSSPSESWGSGSGASGSSASGGKHSGQAVAGGDRASAAGPFATVDCAAILVDRAGRISAQSPTGAELATLWSQQVAPLTALVATARTSVAASDRIELTAGPVFWITASQFHQAAKGDVLVIARDVTVPERMTGALMHSRALLKSLLDRASDMAFDMDAGGTFRFISPAEPFGLAAKPWMQSSGDRFFFADGRMPGRNPLQCLESGVFRGVRVTTPDGHVRHLDFDIMVQRDDSGTITGRSGVVRDVSDDHGRESEAVQSNLRLRVESQLTYILNSSESAEHLLERAADALVGILRADTVWMVAEIDDKPQLLYKVGDQRFELPSVQHCLNSSPNRVLTDWPSTDNPAALVLPFQREAGDASTREGFIVISRDAVQYPWSVSERMLLQSVGATLTAAFLRAKMIDRLSQLSSRDGLTQLLNRRALGEAVNRRLKAQAGQQAGQKDGAAGILLFIDLDHFKEVNDTAGHKAGDQALKDVASYLISNIRPADFAGRYGGDEFVVWLDDISVDVAREKAQGLIDHMAKIRETLWHDPLKLGASVGLCESRPGIDLDFEALAERADAALYAAKQHGKGRVIIAGEDP